jgi:hypothetical protein
MTEQFIADAITAIYSITDQLQVMNNTLEHIECRIDKVCNQLEELRVSMDLIGHD